MRYRLATLAMLPVLLALACRAAPARALDVQQPAVEKFITKMAEEHGFDRDALSRLLAATPLDPDVVARMDAPAEALSWSRYRAIFITPERISAGRAFMAAKKTALAAAESDYGVAPAIVAAIVGMESHYGHYEGSYSALSALATLAFDYPRRADFFRDELAKYLLLCRANGFDPRAVESSYAGALGAGQFMPSSYLAYAVDADGGGSDMFASWPDIVSSIAHYLAANGWEADEPVAARAQLEPGADVAHLLGHRVSARELRGAGVVFGAEVANTARLRLVKVETRTGDTHYWVGLPNFSVLMRYNHSPLYALAATQLASALTAASTSDGASLAAQRQ